MVTALLDCNNFYCSCERAADPRLNGVPVAVLSSNDGCIIARSNEVKALGVPMGAPLFKWRTFLQDNNVRVLSANFEMYGHISAHVMNYLVRQLPGVEVYSVDEAFLDFSPVPSHQYISFAEKLHREILEKFKIPVSIGIAPSKALAKVANKEAKRHGKPVHALVKPAEWEPLLRKLPVGEVWGVGRQLARRFQQAGIGTAYELSQLPDNRKDLLHSVVERQLVHELRGLGRKAFKYVRDPESLATSVDHAVNAGRYTTVHEAKKHVSTSRSFAHEVLAFEQLAEAVSWFAAVAARKLRAQYSAAGYLRVYLRTNRFKDNPVVHSAEIRLPLPTDYTPDLQRHAITLLRQAYVPGTPYNKGGLDLAELRPASAIQADLFCADPDEFVVQRVRQIRLNQLVDRLNHRLGNETVYWGRGTMYSPGDHTAPQRPWAPLSQRRNPHEADFGELNPHQAEVARPWW